MRLLAFSDWRVQDISDVFTFLENCGDPVDLILYGGDDVRRFEEEGVNHFTRLSEYANERAVLGVLGNDDDSSQARRVLRGRNVHDLHRGPYVFGEFAFIGLESSTRGPAIIQHTEAEVRKQLQKQHSQVRGKRLIVLSHAPPYGILDRGIRFATSNEKTHHIGSTALAHFIKRTPVDLVVCGHCHSHGRRALKHGSTTIVNVASHDSRGANGNFALIDLDSAGNIEIQWHDTTEYENQTSLKRLYGVGRTRESMLRRAGIKTLTDLAKGDAEHIAEKSGLSDHFVKHLQLWNKALLDNKIIQTAPLFLPAGSPIFFDIETDLECKRVWLIGVLKDGEFRRFYADTWKEERRILEEFLALLRDSPNSFLAASSGTDFDQRVIRGALNRQALDVNFFSAYPSIDLCQEFRRSLIVPTQSYALKDLGACLGYPFKHPDLDGFFVALEYLEHLSKKKRIDPRVFEYNEDDVRALPFMLAQLVRTGFTVAGRPQLEQLKLEPIDTLSSDLLIETVRELYEKCGYISVRKDKRYDSNNVTLRFYGHDLQELSPVREAMERLGFHEGSPYQTEGKRRVYVPYYGKQQAIAFFKTVNPKVKNDFKALQ